MVKGAGVRALGSCGGTKWKFSLIFSVTEEATLLAENLEPWRRRWGPIFGGRFWNGERGGGSGTSAPSSEA